MNKLQNLKEQATELGVPFDKSATIKTLTLAIKLFNESKEAEKIDSPNGKVVDSKEKIAAKKQDAKDNEKAAKKAEKIKLKEQAKAKKKQNKADAKQKAKDDKDLAHAQFVANAEKAAKALAINGDIEAHIDLKPGEKSVRARRLATRKERVIVRVYDPKRKAKAGDVYRARNSYSGPTAQMVLYNEEPQYLPTMIISALRDAKFQKFTSKKDPRTGDVIKTSKQSPAFGVEYLDHLNDQELSELAIKQASSGVLNED